MKKKISPFILLIFGFTIVILIGAFLLLLPFATYEDANLSFIDALFTSTSAVCVTGLVSVPTVSSVFTLFGKIVILVLIEIGGLGFVTIAMFLFTLLGLKINMQDRLLIKESLNQNTAMGMVRLVKNTVFITLIIQMIGAVINFIAFRNEFDTWNAIGISIFHAVSAFNNAGFDLFTSGTSLMAYKDNILINLNTSFLIIMGGIGFVVIYDVFRKKSWNKLSIHSKIVIKTSLFLIMTGTVLLKLIEGSSITWLQAYFNSVSARTAGFSTVDFNLFANASLLVMMALMYIGASPASTAGGIKTTSLYTIYKYLVAFATGKDPVAYNRQIARGSVVKAFILIVLSLLFILFSIFFISIIESKHLAVNVNQYQYLTKIVFEVFSAFGTVGNSMGITAGMHWLSKLMIVFTMFFGRLGPITIISAWNKHWNVDTKNNVKLLEERIMIG